MFLTKVLLLKISLKKTLKIIKESSFFPNPILDVHNVLIFRDIFQAPFDRHGAMEEGEASNQRSVAVQAPLYEIN